MSWWSRFFSRGAKLPQDAQEGAGVADEKFRPGQSWTYRTRPGEEKSRVVIGRVDQVRQFRPDGEAEDIRIVSVSLVGLDLKMAPNTSGASETLAEISHLPMDRRVLESGVLDLDKEGVRLPADFAAGYRTWRRLFDAQQAGYYKIPLAQCVALAEQTFRSQGKPRVQN